MSKKILVISSTPRKGGNSDLLADQLAQGAQKAGHEVEKIFLGDKKISYCKGCGACLNGKNRCPLKDDMPGLLDKLIAADVIALATPVYFYTMSAQMKTFIDRVCSRYTEVKNKEFYFILTAADTNLKAMGRTVESFRGFTSCLDGADEKGIIYGLGVWAPGEIKDKPAMKEAFEMGRNMK